MDESITNAVQATIKNPNKFAKNLYITIRYAVSETEFDATIIDHGTGFDLIKTLGAAPDNKSNDYHNQIISYTIGTGKSKSSLKMNNKKIFLRGVGAGLKIILNFMDSVTIEYIDKKTIIAKNVSESTDGTIFNMTRKRRHFNNE
jgi:anti-sigma regulatory factor (Ser/Thr protein kinase)